MRMSGIYNINSVTSHLARFRPYYDKYYHLHRLTYFTDIPMVLIISRTLQSKLSIEFIEVVYVGLYVVGDKIDEYYL